MSPLLIRSSEADGQVLARLGHDALVGGNHQHGEIDAAHPGQHVLDEALVARHVDDLDGEVRLLDEREARSMVMPRAFSSGRRSVSVPVSALTSEVLPWSMCPAVPTTTWRAALIRPRRR
jgi:hypothetical protein